MTRAIMAVTIAFVPIGAVCLVALITGIATRHDVLIAALCCTALLLSYAAVRARNLTGE